MSAPNPTDAPDTPEMARWRRKAARRHATALAEARRALDTLSVDAANLIAWGALDASAYLRAHRRRPSTEVMRELGLIQVS
jgi:hypothetical protein